MPRAIITQAYFVANPSTTYTATAAAPGDSLTVPYFTPGSAARLEQIIRGGATAGAVRIISPRLHDNVTGLTFLTDKVGTVFELPRDVGQPLYAVDTWVIQMTGATNETEVAVTKMYFDDLPGAAARLVMYEDIKNSIVNLKTVEVDTTASATIGNWKDTAQNATEDQLKADTNYAVLGMSTDTQITAMAIKGPDTANYRIGIAGADDTFNPNDGFIRESERHGRPHIPVINSNNRANTYVSTVDKAASTTAKVQLILAQLDPSWTMPS